MSYFDGRFRLERKLIELLPDGIDLKMLPGGHELLRRLSGLLPRTDAQSLEVYPLLGVLAKMTEWDRQSLFAEILADAPPGARAFWLWELGDHFVEHGHYALAAAAFVRGALSEESHAVTRAALLVKAGRAGSSGSLGSAAEQWLVNGTTILEQLDRADSAAVRLALFMAHYTSARHHIYLDASRAAEDCLNRAIIALTPDTLRLLGFNLADEIPDVLLLRARISRGRLEIMKEGSLAHVLSLLDQAESRRERPILLNAPFSHHIAFQRAAALRMDRQHQEAMVQADVACRLLAGVSLTDATAWVTNSWTTVNRYRLGYVLCLAGEIALDANPTDIPGAVNYLETAAACWSDPYYARGLSTARRLQGIALMREGRSWFGASRLLTESLAHARGQSVVCEARAVASKIALHKSLDHAPRVKEYEIRLSEIRSAMSAHWQEHWTLDALTHGYSRPQPPLDQADDDLKKLAKAHGLLGEDRRFVASLRMAFTLAAVNESNIFIDGESGTGKTEMAQLIHSLSKRQGKFVKVALSEIMPGTAASELFGHEKGAFTSADRTKRGLIEDADGGTLFLDDVTDADLAVQTQLLSVVHTRTLRHVGGNKSIPVDFCLICATNKDIQAEVEAGRFKDDLRARIFRNAIHLPPLRERGHDVQIIGQRLLENELATLPDTFGDLRCRVKALTTRTWDELCSYRWIDNIRTLMDLMSRIKNALAAEAMTGTNLDSYVNEAGEVSSEFVHTVMERLQVEGLQALESDDPANAPMVRRDDDQERLQRHLAVTPAVLNTMILHRPCKTKSELVRCILDVSPHYKGKPASVLQALRRAARHNKAYARILEQQRG